MATPWFDTTILLPFVGIISTLLTLAVFDLYAFSPRPSGLAKRSRELAPTVTIAVSIGIAALSLFPLSGANEAMLTLQAERIRLFSYPLVVTNALESLAIGLALMISAYFTVTQVGLLGWSLIVLAITLLNGVLAVASNPSGVNYGAFELIFGLTIASAYAFSRQSRSKRQAAFELAGLAVMVLATAASGALTDSPVRLELVVGAVFVGVSMTAFLFHLATIAGPHWEATSLFFVSGLATFVVAGFALAIAPHFFDREKWQDEVTASRAVLQIDLMNTLRPIELGAGLTPENERLVAKRFESGATRLKYLAATAERSSKLQESDLRTVAELKVLERELVILGRLHESRALVADSDRRTSAAQVSSTDPSHTDPMAEFWQQDRPWLIAALQRMKDENSSTTTAFIASMETDLDRLTRAAVEVEIHRVDVWVDWAARQPRELVPLLKQTAAIQIARLDGLAVVTEPLPLRKDSRFYALHQSLRKMASVSESKWE